MLNLMGSQTTPEIQVYKAYSTIYGFKFGLDFTNFANQRAFPKTLDYEGPTGLPAVRTGQISYTYVPFKNNYLSVALENNRPEVSGPTEYTYAIEQVPTVVLKGASHAKNYSLEIAGLYRHIKVLDSSDDSYDQKLNGMGGTISISRTFQNKDKFIIGYLYGNGITSMIQDTVGLKLDAAPKSITETDLRLVDYISFWTSYKRNWGKGFSSLLTYSITRLFTDFMDVDSYLASSNGIYEFGQYASLNL